MSDSEVSMDMSDFPDIKVVGPWLESFGYARPKPCDPQTHVWVADPEGWFHAGDLCKCGQSEPMTISSDSPTPVTAFNLTGLAETAGG